jgi:hypothetical protein
MGKPVQQHAAQISVARHAAYPQHVFDPGRLDSASGEFGKA